MFLLSDFTNCSIMTPCSDLYLCHTCGDYLTSYNHSSKCRTRILTCKICDKSFKMQKYLAQHIKSHNVEKFSCVNCPKLFKTKKSLNLHIKEIHTDKKQKTYYCNICEAFFNRKGNLNLHMKLHSDKLFPCSFCTKSFHRKCSKIAHEKICCCKLKV